MNYTDRQIEEYLMGIYTGKYDASEKLPEDLYLSISQDLLDGLDKGIGGVEFGKANPQLIQEFRENIYMFSGAKTYQQVREMSGFLADSKNFKEFKEKVMPIYEEYNKNWLKAEYDTAYGQGTIANQWANIHDNKDTFPYLKYVAVGDANTSEICLAFDGTTLPVDHEFWNKYSPLNHFRCRCILEQLDEYTDEQITPPNKVKSLTEKGGEDVDEVFQMNPYRDGYVFSPEHPYFKVASKDKNFAASNFNLPIPETLKPEEKPKTIKERIADIKVKAKQLKDDIGKDISEAQEKIKAKVDEANIQIDKVNRIGRIKGYLDPEYLKERKIAEDILKEKDALVEAKRQISKKYNSRVVDLLESKNAPSEFNLVASKSQKTNIANLNDGEDAFRRIVGDAMPKNGYVSVNTLKKGGRAYHSAYDKSIAITKDEDIGTITHELAHALEDQNPDHFSKIKDFYNRRTLGEKKVRLKDITRLNYRATEVTKQDKWKDPYIGKWYDDGKGNQRSSEITSMWFTEVFTDLHGFMESDPDYFEEVFKLFNQ